jgi:hypothetical protein
MGLQQYDDRSTIMQLIGDVINAQDRFRNPYASTVQQGEQIARPIVPPTGSVPSGAASYIGPKEGSMQWSKAAYGNLPSEKFDPSLFKGVKEPPIAGFRGEAAAIESTLPEVPNGMTRLWRGNRKGEVGNNPSFTNDLPGIAIPFRNMYGGELSYVDVPTEHLPKYEQTIASAPGAEFILPKELYSLAKRLDADD